MKKIVALVLSLVMALSLATVAFGEDYIKGNKMYDVNANGSVNYEGNWNEDVVYSKAVVNANGSGTIGYYQLKSDSNRYFVPCDWTTDYKVWAINDGLSFECYVREVNMADLSYVGEATVVSKNDGPADCTTNHFKTDGYMYKGNFYVAADRIKDAGNYINVLVGSKIVYVKAAAPSDYVMASHVLLKGTKDAKTGWDVCKCAICGATFACTNSMDVLKANAIKEGDTFSYSKDDASKVITEQKAAGKYSLPVGTNLAGSYTYCWQLTAGTDDGKKDDGKKPGVDSAKTFDAGIAMYVGMSLLSVAGSAVVIGKKKEF